MMGYLALLRGAVGNNIMKSVTALALLISLFNLYTPCEEISVEAKCKQKLSPSPGPGRVMVGTISVSFTLVWAGPDTY